MSAYNKTIKLQDTRGLSPIIKLLIIVATGFFLYTTIVSKQLAKMSSTSQTDIPIKIILSDIQSISAQDSSFPAVSLKVTLQNTSPDKPVTFLRWSTPLDPKAAAMGKFVFTSKKNGKAAKSLGLKLNKKIPSSGIYPSDDILRLEAGGTIEKVVDIKAPEVELQAGEKYAVTASGFWMHVQVGDHEELKAGEKSALRGDFESEAVEVEIPS